MNGRFEILKGMQVRVWLQDNGNRAVIAALW